MTMQQWKLNLWDFIVLFLIVWCSNLQRCSANGAEDPTPSSAEEHNPPQGENNKLLIIMLDGFRWDYYEQQKNELRGFPLFLQEGVQAQWVEPVFPSESYPAWETISTGVFPENHGILGNYMFDLKRDEVFDLDNETSTRKLHWWQDAEPIWTTATRYNKKSFLRFWSRCDVPYDEIIPDKCTGYTYAPGVQAIRDTLNLAIDHLLKDYQLAMVYAEHLDNIGHEFGPYSEELKQAIRDVDDVFYDFLDRLTDTGLDEKVNVILVSDHGMTWIGEGSGTVIVPIEDYVQTSDVYKVLGHGSTMSISPYRRSVEKVYQALKGKRGFDVYKREEIPEEFRYKNHRLVQEIIIVAKPHFYLQGLQSFKQIPKRRSPFFLRGGAHGYHNMTDMRTIFFAKGPDFKKGLVHSPIDLVDEYQLFAHLLKVPPQANNGTWSKVAGICIVGEAIKMLILKDLQPCPNVTPMENYLDSISIRFPKNLVLCAPKNVIGNVVSK